MDAITAILSGETANRENHSAHPMTEAEARHILNQIEREMPKSRRGRAVRMFADSPHARLSDAARSLYSAYAAAYGA